MRKNGWILPLALAFAGCVGTIGTGDSDKSSQDGEKPPIADNNQAFKCDESAVPDSIPLRRLSALQYKNALRDVLTELGAKSVLTTIAPKLDKLPDDRKTAPNGETHGGFKRLDQVVNQEHVNVEYDVAVAIGKALDVRAIAGACATDTTTTNDDSCLDQFIRKVGMLVQRRPLEDEDVAFYKSIAGADKVSAAALGDVTAALFASPRFLYHVEANEQLDGYELAARLSFHFWQTTPDKELRDTAATLTDPAVFQKQVHRLFADPRTDATLDDFFREWLWLDELPEMNTRVGDAVYNAFAGSFVPTADLREQMIDDVLIASRTAAKTGTFVDFFTNKQPNGLAEIYGDGKGRVGLITRPAFLATGSANTRPIMKGVFIRKALLCDEIPPPPNNAAANAPVLSPTMTTREVVEQLTQKPGTACSSCHANIINPLGFATENFDALGRYRSAQKLFDDSGKLITEKAVNTASVPKVTPDDFRESAGAEDLSKYLLESGKVQRCFARQYFRFTYQRAENEKDGCALKEVSESASGGQSLAEVMMRIALRPEFKRRAF
jgi:hypothetical protein